MGLKRAQRSPEPADSAPFWSRDRDVNSPEFKAELARQAKLLDTTPDEQEAIDWVQRMHAEDGFGD